MGHITAVDDSIEEATKKVNSLYLDSKISLMADDHIEDYGLKAEEVYRFEFNKNKLLEFPFFFSVNQQNPPLYITEEATNIFISNLFKIFILVTRAA